jgi:hypothetical protein
MAVILTWQDWRVEQINLDGRHVLRIRHGHYLMGYAKTVPEALAVLARNGVPADELTPGSG